MFKIVLCLAVLSVSLNHVRAKVSQETELAMLKHFDEYVEQCGKELNLNVEKINEQHKTGEIDGVDKCLYGCVLKKEGSINDEGKYDLDKGLESLRGFIENDDDYKFMETISKVCLSVNDEEVSDGDKGCERAYLLLACIKKEKKSKK